METSTSRITAYGAVATALALCGDREIGELMDKAVPLGSGIGGRSASLEVAGTRVFAKRVPLTDLELRPENVRSTANVFGVPSSFHYGMGNPGFGAWRELATHVMTTNWVLTGRFPGFPLMYHWRVLPDTAQPPPDELADVEAVVAYWGGGQEVRDRIEARRRSSSSLVLFLEHFPHNLHDWLRAQVAAGEEAASLAYDLVERELEAAVSVMNAHGLLHFDAHYENVLTDGRHLYVADFGLALSSRFDLSPEEVRFFQRHLSYDRCYTRTHLVHWLTAELLGADRDERDALIREWALGEPPTGVPRAVAAVLSRHSPPAAVMSDFRRRLRDESRRTPYPDEEIRRLPGCDSSRFS
ncbi:protein kinase family protein [Nonomuraea sp. K274]|uniref:Protein kinase family protein n=1 Tax=Nonomuraea cypriaca TaxID=1187855 RepID=A0A931F2X3_9ACTN|nr:protein kinase family protein [Nonomuraea cypriaca]MBF8189546.1 protein kinase family protein [Nonomuraea cypriaca]